MIDYDDLSPAILEAARRPPHPTPNDAHDRILSPDYHLDDLLADTERTLIEMPELAHPSIPGRGGLHHLGFRLPLQRWHALRSRLDAASYPYREIRNRLFLRDADGLLLEIEQAL